MQRLAGQACRGARAGLWWKKLLLTAASPETRSIVQSPTTSAVGPNQTHVDPRTQNPGQRNLDLLNNQRLTELARRLDNPSQFPVAVTELTTW